MARKTKEEALRTRQLLIESAIQQFALRGVTNTTLTDIADAAGVTRGAVYWHFASKTELFNEIKTADTPIIVERVVTDIDEIVRLVRFPGWQGTQAGEREVKKALRKALFKYQLHADEELYEKAYSYIRQYY